jgi:hypothetical protein
MKRCFRVRNLAAATLLALPLAHRVQAQVRPPTQTTVVTAGPDSAQVSTAVVPDSVRRTARLFGLKMTKPSKAGLLSALLPGAGQIYNRRWWKLPLVYGAVGGTLYGELFYLSRYKLFVKESENRLKGIVGTNTLTQKLTGAAVDANLYAYRTQRDTFIAYVALAHAAQILDAVVDAHLRDFDISDDLSLRWDPTLLQLPTAGRTPTPGIGLTLSFK